jgi:beta-lactamase regulating signal transducer with metallopeptidase domain
MIAVADWLVPILVRGSLAMMLAMLIVRMTRPRNLMFRRTACVVVLLHGWLLAPWTLEIPWYDATPRSPISLELGAPSAMTQVPPSTVGHLSASPEIPLSNQFNPSSPSGWQRLRVVLFAIWLIGVIGLVLHHARSLRQLWIASHRWRQPPANWSRAWSSLLVAQRCPDAIPMWVSDNHGPMLCRLPQQMCLVVPERYWSSCDEHERLTVLRHELAHHQNHDVEKGWGMGVLALPYWFHPATWWLLAEFHEAAELRCDREAAVTLADRSSFLRALGKLVVNRNSTTFVAGHSAHAHPLLLRMRRLTEGPHNEESMMKKCLVSGLMVGLLLVQAFRLELVAQEPSPPMSVVATKERMEQLDAKILSLGVIEESMKKHAEELKETVDAKSESLEKLRNAPEKHSEAAVQRSKLFLSGGEAEQLKAIADIDEAVLLCGHIADQSTHAAVRQAALKAACSFGKEGYPAIAIAYEGLSTADKIFLVEQMRQFEPEDRVVLMALMAKDANKELLSKLIAEPLADDRRLVLLGKLVEAVGDDAITEILKTAESTAGEQGLLLLYSAAKAEKPEYVLQAVKSARKRGPIAYPVIAAAGKSNDPTVRAEVVRAAKTWGGEVGDFIIEKAQQEPDEALRKAAEQALAE